MLGAIAATLLGCPDDEAVPPAATSSGTGGHEPVPPPISAKASVKFKTKVRLVNDIANALELDPSEVCLELGQYDCADVHTIALGGVDPYSTGIFEPLKSSAVTSPIAVDRLVLAACQRRAIRDIADTSSAALYKLTLDGDKLADVDDPSVEAVIVDLFNRVHLREPKPAEVAHLRQLYRDFEASGKPKPAESWAILSCYSVLTMMESVFY